jgi:NADH-quinone oxidoreductase subunit C
MTPSAVTDALKPLLPQVAVSQFRSQTRVVVPREALYAALERLRDDQGFDLLVDLTCVDYLDYRTAPDRFGMVYLLANTTTNDRLTVRTYLGAAQPSVASVVSLWEGANWLEREVWDLFGITFEGHPDHRRIVLPEAFSAHPLRKDYPLQGRGERHHFPVIRRGEES